MKPQDERSDSWGLGAVLARIPMEPRWTTEAIDGRITEIMANLWFRYIRPFQSRYQTTEADLTAFEQRLGRKLPAEYRIFLRRFGISAFDNRVEFKTPGAPGGDTDWLWVFYGYSPGDGYHIENEWDSWRCNIPDHYLPIACTDATGATLFVSMDDSDCGSIYYIDRETNWDYDEAAAEQGASFLDYSTKLAPSFLEFLEGLRGEDPINRAVKWGSLDELRGLLEEGHPANRPDHLGFFPCENAVGPGMGIEKLRLLIEHGAPVKLALIPAAWFEDFDAMKLLLANGADVNARDGYGRYNGSTALLTAISYQKKESVRFLLSLGADTAIQDGRRLTALELAIAIGNNEIVSMLRDAE